MAISVQLPLSVSDIDGFYSATYNPKDVARNNLFMLLYTYPGERIWDINFGVGIEKYLFENNTPSLLETLRQRIVDQVSTYLPYLNLKNLEIDTDEINLNKISIRLEYEVAGFVDLVALEFRVDEPS